MRRRIGLVLAVAGWLAVVVTVAHAEEPPTSSSEERSEDSQPPPAVAATPAAGAAEAEVSATNEETAPSRVSMAFQDANLKDVLKLFSQQTGLNVIASEDVGDRTITLYLEDVPITDALDQILRAAGLAYERPLGSEIYIVKSSPKKPDITTITRVYPLRFARVSTSRLSKAIEALTPQTLNAAQQLTALTNPSATSSTGGSTTGGGEGATGATSRSTGGTGGTSSGEGIGINKVVEKLLTKDGKVVVDERTNRLVVTDVPENFSNIEAVINALDIKTAQILIEAELLETTLAKLKDLGVKWGSGSEGTLFQLTPARHSTRFPFEDFFGHGLRSETSDVKTPITSSQLGTLDTSQAVAVLQALERDTDTKILARPKVLTLDNESAVIRLTSQQAIGFTTTTTAQAGTTTATPERTLTGVALVVTPQVNEGGFVTMFVEPSVTKVVPAQITPPTNVGGSVVDPKTRSARALVRIRQGETLVLGGLVDRSDIETTQRVPVISQIPVVGEAFKHKAVDRSASELIVFVTPRILEESPATQVASVGPGPFAIREQESSSSRQDVIEQALKRLEQPRI